MELSRKLFITGHGRCGTTFMVKLLTELGLDTGYADVDIYAGRGNVTHGGGEKMDPRTLHALMLTKDREEEALQKGVEKFRALPYVIKIPWILRHPRPFVSLLRFIEIDDLIWTIRSFDSPEAYGSELDWKTWSSISLRDAVTLGLEPIFLCYPRLALDGEYTWGRIGHVIRKNAPGIGKAEFLRAFAKICVPQWVTRGPHDGVDRYIEKANTIKAAYANG